MKLIAHRGGRGFGPDNTLEAMESAVKAGVWMLEFDVRCTADGRLVICHDATFRGRQVSRTNFEELRRHSPERPLLEEVLERLAGRVSFDIEVKEAPERSVGEMIENYGLVEDTLVSSFQRDFLERLKESYPYLRTGYLYRMSYREERKLDAAAEMGAEVLLPHFHSIDRELVENAHEAGIEVYAWTVNDEDDVQRLREWGVDGIVTDRYLEVKSFLEGPLTLEPA